jgi:hypothetical protein
MPWLNAAQASEVTRTRVIMSASAGQHIVAGSVIDAMDTRIGRFLLTPCVNNASRYHGEC